MKSGIKITGGAWNGRSLAGGVPHSSRPTSSRVREAIGSILGQKLRGAQVLDAFSGSGAMSFECLSRGARRVIAVECDLGAQESIIQSYEQLCSTDPLGAFSLVRGDSLRFLNEEPKRFEGQFDIVLLDPPYASNLSARVLEVLVSKSWIHTESTILIERARNHCELEPPKSLAIRFQRRYGDTELLLLGRKDSSPEDQSSP